MNFSVLLSHALCSRYFDRSGLGRSQKYKYRNPVDADADTDTDTRTQQETQKPRSRGVSGLALYFHSLHSPRHPQLPSASFCSDSRVGSSQLDTEPVASPTALLKRDLEGVEAQLRGLANRRARVEAKLLRVTCEETFLRRQQLRPLHGISAANTVRMPTRWNATLRWTLPPAQRRQVFLFRNFTLLYVVGLCHRIALTKDSAHDYENTCGSRIRP